jgi:flagellin
MVELTTTAANDTHSEADRGAIQDELDQLYKEVDRIAYTTNFNQNYMLNQESNPNWADFQIQAGELAGESIRIDFVDATAVGLGIGDKTTGSLLDVSSYETAGQSLERVQNAIELAAIYRDDFGGQQTRLESTVRNTDNTSENTQASESSMRDTNMNMELVLYTTNKILVHASQSILAQYNDDYGAVRKLLA